MHIHTYVCTYGFVCIYTSVYAALCIYVHTYVNTYVHIKLLELEYHRMLQNEITYKNVILYLMNFVLISWTYIHIYYMYMYMFLYILMCKHAFVAKIFKYYQYVFFHLTLQSQ